MALKNNNLNLIKAVFYKYAVNVPAALIHKSKQTKKNGSSKTSVIAMKGV